MIEMTILKQAHETHFDYVKRLTENRKELDLDYAEWAKLITNGSTYSSDNARKAYYIINPLLGALDEDIENRLIEHQVELTEAEDLNDLLLELETKKLELQKERVKFQTLKNELNKNVRDMGRKELFYEQLLEEVRKNPLPIKPFTPSNYFSPMNRQSFVQVISDIHYGATFEIPGVNSYSPEICQQRFENLIIETFRLAEKEGFDHLIVANCGDSLQGILRQSDLKLNSITMVQQIMGIARLIAEYLNELSTKITVKYIHTIQANHADFRLLGSKKPLELNEDVELLIGNWIKDLLINNPRVEVVIATDTVHHEDIQGFNVGFLHGQEVKNFESFIRDISFHHKRHYSYMLMGHIHHMRSVTVGMGELGETVQITSIPSMVGSCHYSQKLMKSSPAGALLLCFEEGKGKTLTYEIGL